MSNSALEMPWNCHICSDLIEPTDPSEWRAGQVAHRECWANEDEAKAEAAGIMGGQGRSAADVSNAGQLAITIILGLLGLALGVAIGMAFG